MASGSDADVGLRLRLFGRQQVRTDLNDTSDDLDDVGSRGERAARGLAAIGERGIAAGIRGIGAAGQVAAVGLGVAVGAAGVLAKGLYEVGAIFDDVSDTIRTGTGAQGAALDELNAVALNIGTTIPASFEDISGTVAALNARLGLTGEPLQHVASQMLALKNLGLETDINTVTGAMAAYGVSTDQVGSTLDDLFRVSQATGVGVNELATAAASGAPALTQFGFSIGDSAALIGTLDKAGVDSAGTIGALRKGLGAFAKAGKDPQQALRDTVAGIDELVQAGKGAEAINLASGVFGTKGAAQFVAAVESGKVNLDALMVGVGATDDTILGLQSSTADFAEQWLLFKNVLLVAVKPAGDFVFGAIGEQMARVTDGVRTLTGDLPALEGNLRGLLSSEQIGALGPQLEAAFKLPPGTISGLQEPLDVLITKGRLIATVLSTAFEALQSIPISPLNLANNALEWAATHTTALKALVIGLTGAYVVSRGVLIGYAVAQGVSNVATAINTGLITANNAVFAASRTYIATWIGVKALEAGAWARSTAAAGASTAVMLAHRVAYGVSYLTTFIAVKGLELAAWARTTAAAAAATAGTLAAAAASGIARAAVLTWTAVQWLLNAALTANPIGLVVAGIALLVGGIVLAYNKSETFRNIVQGLWGGIKTLAGWLVTAFLKFTPLGIVISAVTKNFDGIKAAVGGFVTKIKEGVTWVGKLADKLSGGLVGKALGAVGLNIDGAAADGGTIRSGQTFLVGERGPELFTAGLTGTILPSEALSALLSSPVPSAAAAGTPSVNLDDDDAGIPDGMATLSLTIPVVIDGREVARASVNGMHTNAAWQ